MVNIVHISDLHISEHILRGPSEKVKVKHRYGHDVTTFLALDRFLKETDWDVLLITGDISRIGNKDSFEAVRNWLENEIVFGGLRIGLNLSKSTARHYVVVPGNHDRFNGQLTQNSLDNYHQEFDVVRPGEVRTINVRDETINLHLFDSTQDNNSFARGAIAARCLVAKNLKEDEVDLALLHHHFLQPPKHRREFGTELSNSAEVAAYMLSAGFDGIFFGHTHKGYIDRPSVEILSEFLSDRRKTPRFWSRRFPTQILARLDQDSLVSYPREAARNGQLPRLSTYFDFLFLQQRGADLAGPRAFQSIKGFYEQMEHAVANHTMAAELAAAKKKCVLVSLAPSACQAEARWNGFHVIRMTRDANRALQFDWDRYEFKDVGFAVKPRDEHAA